MKFSKRCSSYRMLQVSILSMTMFAVQFAAAQSMGISSSAITPDASSILEMRTTTKGLLIPRLTTTERDNIGTPATGLMVYNTTTNKFNFYNGSGWIVLVSGSVAVTSVTGTSNRITIGGTASDPIVDISSSYVGQSSITTLGTIGTGTWNGSLITGTYGGTGVNNGSNTITLGGNLVTSGAFATTLTSTATTNATLPAGTNTLYSTKAASITSAQLLASLTDATGTGVAVFGSTPTLATPVINGLPTGTGVASAATASTLVARDANANTFVNNVNRGYATTATAAGTTTLTVSSAYLQFFTGSTTQTVVLPVTSTLVLGQQYSIINNSTGVVTVQSSGANTIQAMAAGSSITVTCILTSGTGTASWSWDYMPAATSSNTANTLVLRDASGNFSAGTITAAITGNASTATTLANSRNIYGNAFNGSADVTGIIVGTYGGTGVNNGSNTITLGGNLVTSGAFSTTITSTATTNATLPAGTNTLYSTKAASITSAQLLASLTDPTGTGTAVFSASPVLTTPTLGIASSTSSTITGTAGTGYLELQSQSSFPSTGVSNSVRLFSNVGSLAWKRSDGFVRSFGSTLTADRTYTLPDASGTVAVSASGNIALSAAGNVTFTGTLPIANGGTNSTATPTNGGVVYGNGSSYAVTGAGTSGQILQSTGAGAPTWANGGTMMFAGNSDNTAVNNTTEYFMMFGSNGNATDTRAGTRNPVSRAGTVRNLYVHISVALGSGKTGTVTVMKNGVATALVATLSVGPTSFSDLSNSVSFAAGDEIGIKVTTTGNVKFSWACDYTF